MSVAKCLNDVKFTLMRNNIISDDLEEVIKLLRQPAAKLTSGPKVKEFEEEWSRWLGVKHSVFVNSGSSANLLCMAWLKTQFPEGGKVVIPPFTWSSDISSVYWMGFELEFVDIKMNTLAIDGQLLREKIEKDNDIKAVFLTHAQGINGLTDDIYECCKQNRVILIEDVCESHGVKVDEVTKAGAKGDLSCFSYYYAHHMSTIEGGMICTNSDEIYECIRMMRGHGMLREAQSKKLKSKYESEYPDLNPQFIFTTHGFNVRNNEIGALIGLSQLKRLDEMIEKRNRNFSYFVERLPNWAYKDFDLKGQSNYAFNIILKDADDELMERLENTLRANEIEYRRGSAGGGNQLRQPYVRSIDKFKKIDSKEAAPVTDHIHFYGLYLGNYPNLEKEEIDEILKILEKV